MSVAAVHTDPGASRTFLPRMTQCITDSGLVRRHAGADVPIFRASNAVFPERRIAALSREPVMAALSCCGRSFFGAATVLTS